MYHIFGSVMLLAMTLAGGARAQGAPEAAPRPLSIATFAAGCFWCIEADFEKVPGVVDAVSGYMGGHVAKPTYEQVSAGGTGHREVVQVRYDPARVSYAHLLDVFWRNVDPFDAQGQFCDKGEQYTGAIYVRDTAEQRLAEASLKALSASSASRPVVTQIVSAGPFHEAEAYHQGYYKRNAIRYRFYRSRCGRDARLAEIRGDQRR
jgi:peptide-methionine (S)-S-oxide reductase